MKYRIMGLFGLVLILISSTFWSSLPQTEASSPKPVSSPSPVFTPAPQLNPQKVLDLLWSQSSFRCIISITGNSDFDQLETIWVREPEGFYFRPLRNGVVVSHFITIGQREWMGLGTAPDTWTNVDSLPVDKKEGTKEFIESTRQLMVTICAAAFPDVSAKLIQTSVSIDNIPCVEYAWTDSNVQEDHVCIDAASGLPVSAELKPLTAVKFSLINDPSNVIKPPASRLSGKLNFDDARMSLNGLSSFQWTYWSEIRQENSTGITELYYQGKYTQVNQAFHVIASIGREEGPAVQFLQVGPNRWIGDAEGETWIDENVAKLSGDSPFNYLAEPFSIWNLYKEVEKEGNMTNSTPILINGQNCNEYLFLGKRTNDKGELISLELKIYFNLETGLPVRVEGSSIKSGAYLHDIWDISHINDPNNTVNPPDD